MNLTHTNEPAGAATVPQILARLILVQQQHQLPDFTGIEWYESYGPKKIDLRLPDRAAFDAWLVALGGEGARVHSVDGWTWVNVWDWHGPWGVRLDMLDRSVTELDTDTVAGLEEVAAALADNAADLGEAMLRQAEQIAADACGRCQLPFDPADKRHDGRARYEDSRWCRGCIDRCHEASEFDHSCPICTGAVSA